MAVEQPSGGEAPETESAPHAPPRRASLSLNAFALVGGNLALYGVIFLLTPLAIRHLGEEGWGIWQLMGATATYASLLNLSLTTALHYQVAVCTASRDWGRLAIAFTNVRLYLLGAGVLLLLATGAFGKPFVRSLVEPRNVELAWTTLAVTMAFTALDLQTRIYGSVLAGLQRVDVYGGLQVVGAVLLFAVIGFGLPRGMGLPGFAAAMTLGSAFAALLCWAPARMLLPRDSFRFRRPEWPLFREMIGYSVSTVVYAAGGVVLYQTMKYLAAWRCGGTEAAGQMGLAISLSQTLSVVFAPAVMALISRVGQLHGERRLDEVPALLDRVFVALGLLLLPSVVFLGVATRSIFDAWVGGEMSPDAIAHVTTTTRLLVLGHAFYIAALPFYNAMLGIGQHRIFGVGMLVTAIANSVLGWVLAGLAPRIEVLAAVYAVLMLALVALVTAPAGLRRFPLPLASLLGRAVGLPLLAAFPGAAAVWLRPRVGKPLVDLGIDVMVFTVLCLPGLELARRRLGVRLRIGI